MADAHAVTRWGRATLRDRLTSRFFVFAKESGMCPDITEIEYGEICDYLESFLPNTKNIIDWRLRTGRIQVKPARFAQNKGIFMIPRLTFKTSLVAALCLFAYVLDNAIRITLGRASTTDAETTLSGTKDHLENNPVLIAAFGEMRSHFGVWTSTHITSNNRPPGSREATIDTTGLLASKTGFHPDLVILDDLVNETNYQSPTETQNAWGKIHSFLPIIERWGSILVVGTRWGEYDVYGRLLKINEELAAKQMPPTWRTFICGAFNDDGTARFPTPLPDYRIEQMRMEYPPKLFAAWILNQARAQGEDIFLADYIQYVDGEYIGGEYSEFALSDSSVNTAHINRFGNRVPLAVYMYIDPAPTVDAPGHAPRRARDFTGIVVVGFDEDANYWVLHAAEIKEMPTDRLRTIIYLAQTFEPDKIRLENADLDAPLLQMKLAEMGLHTRVERYDPRTDRRSVMAVDKKLYFRGSTKKSGQIEAMEPVLRARRAFFVRGRTQVLVRQILEYPQVEHDDVLDAFSMSRIDEKEARQTLRFDMSNYFEKAEEHAWLTGRANPLTAAKDLQQAISQRENPPKARVGPWAGPLTPKRATMQPNPPDRR